MIGKRRVVLFLINSCFLFVPGRFCDKNAIGNSSNLYLKREIVEYHDHFREKNVKAKCDLEKKIEYFKGEAYIKNEKDTSIKNAIDSILSIGYPIENSLPNGFVKDGSIDYTTYIQAAINSHTVLVFPGFPILVNENGLNIPSNRKIVFSSGSKLILRPTAKGNYKILNINNVSNIALYNLVIEGDRFKHIGSNGEWGMGICIYSATNVQIYNATVSDCWGDGIYIGQTGIKPPSDIYIVNANCNKNGRNGITIVSGDNINLIRPTVTYSDGKPPMAGIDIEPNNPSNILKNINIQEPVTQNNGGSGIQIGISKFMKSGLKDVSIIINSHHDNGSRLALLMSCSPGKGNQFEENSQNGLRYIKILNPVWENNILSPFKATNFRTNRLNFEILNPIVKNSQGQIMDRPSVDYMLRKSLGMGGAVNIRN